MYVHLKPLSHMEIVKEALKGVVRISDDAHRVSPLTKQGPESIN